MLPLLRLLRLSLIVILSFAVSFRTFAQAVPPSQPQQSAPPAKPKRVYTDLTPFHLANRVAPPNETTAAAPVPMMFQEITVCAPDAESSASVTPLFVWKARRRAGATLKFFLLNSFGQVIQQQDVTGSSLRYPADSAALIPGQSYLWIVSYDGVAGPPRPVSFQLRKPPSQDQLATQLSAAGADPLDRAQVFYNAGLWYDTYSTLEDGMRAYPGREDIRNQLYVLEEAVSPACFP